MAAEGVYGREDGRGPVGPGRVLWFLLLSLLLHGLVLRSLDLISAAKPAPEPPPPPLKVTLAPPPPPAPSPELSRQIVDAPPVASSKPPEKAFLGVRDQSVPQETIAPNIGKAENAEASESEAVPESEAPPANAQPQGAQLTKLLPDPYRASRSPSVASRQQNAVERQLGPVTLLNTKSHPFAQYLIDRGYRAVRLMSLNAELTTWYFGDVENLHFPAYASVVLDAEGELLSSRVEQSSGSGKVDNMLLNAIRGAVRGTPPPAEALERGRVEIVLVLEPNVLKIGIR